MVAVDSLYCSSERGTRPINLQKSCILLQWFACTAIKTADSHGILFYSSFTAQKNDKINLNGVDGDRLQLF